MNNPNLYEMPVMKNPNLYEMPGMNNPNLYEMPVAGSLDYLVGDIAACSPEENDLPRPPMNHVKERLQADAGITLQQRSEVIFIQERRSVVVGFT